MQATASSAGSPSARVATGAAPDTAEIWAIYVLPAFWAAGVGRKLWRAARARLRAEGVHKVTLWALVGNARAARFYVAAGFATDPTSVKTFDLGGAALEEVRYAMTLDATAARASVDAAGGHA